MPSGNSGFMGCFNPRSREGSDLVIYSRFLNQLVSIHAPVKGATGFSACKIGVGLVSIHAPVKGATFTALEHVSAQASFNPRSREGSD